MARAQDLASAALDETRTAIAGLRPTVLDDLGLAASLESLGNSFPPLEVRVDAVECAIPEHIEMAVYRTAQEALQNAAKHADASCVRVRLLAGADRVVLEVTDDGKGMAGAAEQAAEAGLGVRPTGFGLSGMRKRAELLGGHLVISSVPGRGTTVTLTVPLSQPEVLDPVPQPARR